MRIFVFQCNAKTYLDCMGLGVFGSNAPWPLDVRQGDYCLLHHYEFDTVLALWRAQGDGGKKLVVKAWGGKYPFQVRVGLATATPVELPKDAVGSDERVLEGPRAEGVLDLVRAISKINEN